MLEVKPLEDYYLPLVFDLEPGEAEYDDWHSRVTSPDWQRFGIFKGEELAGYLGLELRDPKTVDFHISLRRRMVRPKETRIIVIQTGIYLFHSGIERLNTIHPSSNKPACALANACGLALDTYIIRDHTPLCFHTLTRGEYLANPERWRV